MKANSCWKVLEAVRAAGLWIDAVSGNEVLRARRAGFAMGARAAGRHADRRRAARQRADRRARARRAAQRRLARDDRRAARRRLPRADRGAREPGLRPRPRAVVRHRRPVVEARHLARGAGRAARARRRPPSCRSSRCTRTSAPGRRRARVRRRTCAGWSSCSPSAAALPRRRGGQPGRRHPAPLPARARRATTSRGFRALLVEAAARLAEAAGGRSASRSSRGAIPSRARACWSRRVKDIKQTRANAKGPGPQLHHGRRRLQRPGPPGDVRRRTTTSRSSGKGAGRAPEPFVVAGPLCESGDVFTRDDHELLDPRPLPRPDVATCWCCTTPARTARR